MKNYLIENDVLVLYTGNAAQPSIPKNITEICSGAFECCDTLTSIKIPNSVTKIGNSAFLDCINLKSIQIPDSVTYIGCNALDGCKKLTSIEFPKSVRYIDNYAFDGCSNLSCIKIPNSVRRIGLDAFKGIKEVKPQYNSNGTLRAFKGFKRDWTCRDFQYEVGKSFHQDGRIHCCNNGFHACPNPLNIFNYYHGDVNCFRFAEVEISGEMDWVEDKVAASDIKIVRELTVSELAEIYNSMEKC